MEDQKPTAKKTAPKKTATKKAAPKKPPTIPNTAPNRYVSKDPHILVHVIRSPQHEWRARQMLNDGRYVWRIPADQVAAFEAHDDFKTGKVLPYVIQ